MSRARLIGTLGYVLAGLVVVSIVTRSSIKAQQPSAVIATNLVGGGFGESDAARKATHSLTLPMSVAEMKTRVKLSEKIPMNFPNDTPLQEVLKYVGQSTVDKTDFPVGLSIYLDPIGLQEADKTRDSTVAIDMKGIPLATTLKLALNQLDLTYWIHPDGLVIITYKDSEEIPVGSLEGKIAEQLSVIEREVLILRNEIRLLRGAPWIGGMNTGPPAGGMGSKGGMM